MTIEDYLKNRNKNSDTTQSSIRKSIINRTLLTICIVLSIMVICNVSDKFKGYLNKYVFETNYNFARLNALYKKYMIDLKPKSDNSEKVVKTDGLEYFSKSDYLDGVSIDVGDNYNVSMLESGLVVFIGEREGYGNTIVVQQSNGIDVMYGNMKQVEVKIYDYVEKDSIIGLSNDKLYLTFTSEGRTLDYKTYIK